MKIDRREWFAALAPAVLLLTAGAGAAALLYATLAADERATVVALVEPRLALVVLLALVIALAAGWALRRAWLAYGAAPGRLAEALAIELASPTGREMAADGGAGSRALAAALNTLLAERASWQALADVQARDASRQLEQERSRLAALMAELNHSVVVCNLDGVVLLYNQRARLLLRELSPAPALGGAELIGIGRSIYAVLERPLVAHAQEQIGQRLARGEAQPSAQFVTATRSGQLLRVQMAPVRDADAARADAPPDGFVLMLDNITRAYADESERDRRLHADTEASRASLGNLQAAVELLQEGLDADARAQLQAVVRDEVAAMSRRIDEAAAHTAHSMKTRWPLEDMQGADFAAAAQRRIEALAGCRAMAEPVDSDLWLKVDSYSLMQALASLALRLVRDGGVVEVRLHLQRHADAARAQLDLAWDGAAIDADTAARWECEPMPLGDETTALSVRDVVERHAGAFWFERDRDRLRPAAGCFRFLLPLAEAALPDARCEPAGARPEYYDFDLLRNRTPLPAALAERRLDQLSYTVFDTETTGLDPSGGDEIVQIGAARIVNGRLLRHETFEQLVDPRRSMPDAAVAIHGITSAMLGGQPTIDVVLPALHAFAQDTVLVAHNAAFDLRFLQLKEAASGVRFEQPVLDTLLLSALLHPEQASHSLEAIAARFGVALAGRHSALGDALVTAELLLKLLPLLAERGIHTLGEAQAQAQKTYYARVKY